VSQIVVYPMPTNNSIIFHPYLEVQMAFDLLVNALSWLFRESAHVLLTTINIVVLPLV
jgi:hypothetical protein